VACPYHALILWGLAWWCPASGSAPDDELFLHARHHGRGASEERGRALTVRPTKVGGRHHGVSFY